MVSNYYLNKLEFDQDKSWALSGKYHGRSININVDCEPMNILKNLHV